MKVINLVESRREVFSVTADTTVHEAARYLREKQIRAVGVRDSHGKLVGVVSQSDISDKVAAENKYPTSISVSEIMASELIIVPSETALDQCLRLMEKHGIYHLLVVDKNTGYRGMISMQDLLKVIASDQKARADLLEAYAFPQQ